MPEMREIFEVFVYLNDHVGGHRLTPAIKRCLETSAMADSTCQLSWVYKVESRIHLTFWASQGVTPKVMCAFCDHSLAWSPARQYPSGIQIIPCCWSIAHPECLEIFLWANVECPVMAACVSLLNCLSVHPPESREYLPKAQCPNCTGEYQGGLFNFE